MLILEALLNSGSGLTRILAFSLVGFLLVMFVLTALSIATSIIGRIFTLVSDKKAERASLKNLGQEK